MQCRARRGHGTTPVPGAYILLLRLDTDGETEVGRLGRVAFPAGWYAYVGSARSGLEQRVGRHLRGDGKKHWHIDHLRGMADHVEALVLPTSEDIECQLSAVVGSLGGAEGYKGFGCSDCRCWTHLHRLPLASVERLRKVVADMRTDAPGKRSPG